jgi:hypothetical protein
MKLWTIDAMIKENEKGLDKIQKKSNKGKKWKIILDTLCFTE